MTIGASRRPIVLDEGSTYDLQHARLPYVHSRRQGEQAVLAEAERGLPAVVVNPGVLLGPDSTVTQMAANVRMAMAPPGGVNVVDVRDAAHGCVLALTYGRPGQRYILGGENVTARDLVASMLHASRREPPRLTLPPVLARGLALLVRASEIITPLRPPITSQMLRMFPLYFWVSSAKAERELGYLPTRDLAAMVEHREQQVGTPGRIRVETPV
ncbi:MAG: hypothetical protein H6837_19510 [Planctomycetes bacterium]|nr:hypothetical protein [Planctomycetota bacterium]